MTGKHLYYNGLYFNDLSALSQGVFESIFAFYDGKTVYTACPYPLNE